VKKILSFIFFLSIFPQMVYADSSIDFIKNYGGSNFERMNSLTDTSDGNFLVVGYSDSNDGDFTGKKGGTDAIISKLGKNGNKIWTKRYGGSLADSFLNAIETSDGGILAVGLTYSSDGDFPMNKGDIDGLIVKMDSFGNMIWWKTLGGSLADEFKDAAETENGDFLITGYSYSSNGDATTSKGNNDSVLVKIDSNGNLIWWKYFGGSNKEMFLDIEKNSQGNFIATGYSNSSNGDFGTTYGLNDGVIASFDENGNILWYKRIGGTGDDYLIAGEFTASDEIVSVGRSTSTDIDLSSNLGGSDFLVAKLDENGNKIWAKNFGFGGDDSARNLSLDHLGNIYLTGYSTVNGTYDFALSKIGKNGEFFWTNTDGGSGGEAFYGISKVINNAIYLVGHSTSSDGAVPGNKGKDDIIFSKFNIINSYDTKATIGIQGGSFSLSGVVTHVSFANIPSDNLIHTLHSSLDPLHITDNRGTLQGWNLSLSATPFTSISDPGLTLGSNSFVFEGIQSIDRTVGTSSPPVSTISNPVSIDSGNIKIVSAANGNGAGTFEITFPTNSLSVFVDTSMPLTNGGPTTFESTITWILSSGP